jgi:N-acetylmuramoyl-L-alanine amidase
MKSRLAILLFLFTYIYAPVFAGRKNTINLTDTSYAIKKVVIDAGHGGKDSGCLGKNSQEKNITLKIALLVGKKIKNAFPNIEIVYTRDKDVFIPLDERANIANRQKADLFISVHCNFIPANTKHSGSETYVLGLDRSRENLEIAKRENAAIFLEDDYKKRYRGYDFNSPESDILVSAVQSSYMERSMQLAGLVEKHLRNDANRQSRGVKQAGFLVLRETSMPSILVETGFLSSRAEEDFLISAEGQNAEAQAIFDAFSEYKDGVETGRKYDISNFSKGKMSANFTPKSTKKTEDTASVKPLLVSEKKKGKAVQNTAKETANQDVTSVSPKEKKKVFGPEKVVVKRPSSLVFKVQLLKSSVKTSTSEQKWTFVEELEIVEDHKEFIYRADGFETYESASAACSKLKNAGFKEAFIVAFDDGKRINVQEAIAKLKGNK